VENQFEIMGNKAVAIYFKVLFTWWDLLKTTKTPVRIVNVPVIVFIQALRSVTV
jgi:hypothetical protein